MENACDIAFGTGDTITNAHNAIINAGWFDINATMMHAGDTLVITGDTGLYILYQCNPPKDCVT